MPAVGRARGRASTSSSLMRRARQRRGRRPGRGVGRAGRPLARQHAVAGSADDPGTRRRSRMWIRIARRAARRPGAAPRRLHLRQRHQPARGHPGRPRREPGPRPRWPRSTTRSGSTGRSGPTSGGSTTSGSPSAPGGAASRSGAVFTEDGSLGAPRWRRRGSSGPGPSITLDVIHWISHDTPSAELRLGTPVTDEHSCERCDRASCPCGPPTCACALLRSCSPCRGACRGRP